MCLLILSLCSGCKGLGFSLGRSCEKAIFQTLKSKKNVLSALVLWNSDKPGFAKKKSGSKKCFFGTALVKLRQARLCKNKNIPGSKKMFFSALLLWNSDKPGFAKVENSLSCLCRMSGGHPVCLVVVLHACVQSSLMNTLFEDTCKVCSWLFFQTWWWKIVPKKLGCGHAQWTWIWFHAQCDCNLS